ncbi:MAG: glycosyltransferase, partial [Rhodospirillales bacterium]|nr:glycosyltransferase [Rhodospirillales bacterium]
MTAPPQAARWIAGATAPPAEAYDADIVILALDRAEETAAAIASALAQRGARRHLIVLDQGSAPASLARFAALIEGRADAGLYASAINLGVAGGRALASGLGRGRAIVGLDNDACFAGPDVVAGILAAFAADSGLGALGLRLLAGASGADDLSSWGYPRALLARSGERFPAACFVGAGHAIRRAAWDA